MKWLLDNFGLIGIFALLIFVSIFAGGLFGLGTVDPISGWLGNLGATVMGSLISIGVSFYIVQKTFQFEKQLRVVSEIEKHFLEVFMCAAKWIRCGQLTQIELIQITTSANLQ